MNDKDFEKIYLKSREINSLDDAFESFAEEYIVANNLIKTFERIYKESHLTENDNLEELKRDLWAQLQFIKEKKEELKKFWNNGKRNWVSENKKQEIIHKLQESDKNIDEIEELNNTQKKIKKERNDLAEWLKNRNLITLEEYEELLV